MKSKILVLVTAVVFIGMGVFVIWGNDTSTTFDDRPSIEDQPTLGDETAPVSVVEFGDYKCPACKSWGETVFPLLEETYLNSSDDVSFTYINTLFHGEESELAALASESVWEENPDSFWTFHKTIFDNQPDQQNHDERWITSESLGDMAGSLENGPDAEQVVEDVENGTFADEVETDQNVVQEYDIELTPSIMVNGTLLEDPFDWEELNAEIEEALEDDS
ncbi:DsbA family protein [Salibacterium salarium]|uniref:DsbA family protein n=1 Tax=Salibacterium salarium TaxID=284579 RepID=A0A3R9WWL3_9BACI|nr:DsbA family protein [Salibacterium salarium]RSL35102.1 DsbA family protein [Salibacterium salarium]